MIRYFAAHPTAANLLMLLMLIAGLASLPGLKRETLPDFTPKEVETRVLFPGASATVVEEAICYRLEDALDGIARLKEVRCESREGVGIAVAEMVEGGDFSTFLDDVKTEVDAIDSFPDEVEQPIVTQLGRTDQVVSVAVTGNMSVRSLKAYAEELKDLIQQIPQVSQVEILGFSDHQLRVEVHAEALYRYGLSVNDLAASIERQNVRMPVGTIEAEERDFLIRFDDQRLTPRDLEDLVVIGGELGAAIRLGDIATVEDRFELDEEKFIFNGARAAVLKITKTKDQDAIVIVREIKRFVEAQRMVAPPGTEFTITQDVASIVADRLRMLVVNGIEGLILVFLTMWLFFQMRFSFWVTMGLPVSFIAGLFLMSLLGFSINMISMVALLIALGLLMDDAIVISENIASKLAEGKPALHAAVEGTRQVFPGVTSSFLTTLAVFGPLAFIEGDIGKVLGVLPVVLILVLTASLVEAFWILPSHLTHALAHHENESPGRFRQVFDSRIEWLRQRVLGAAVEFVIRWRYPFIGGAFAVFLLSVGMIAGGVLKFRAFPAIDGDVIEARLLLPQGTPLYRTESVVAQVTDALKRVDQAFLPRQPDGQRLVKNVSVRYGANQDAHESGPHVATVTADLLTAEKRNRSIDEILNLWRREIGTIPDVIALNFKEPAIGPGGLAIDIALSGSDLKTLKSASLELQEWLGRYDGVIDLNDDLRPGKPEFRIRIKPEVLGLGIDAVTVASQLRAGFFGIEANEFQVGPESYEIDVQLSPASQDTLEDLEEFRITLSDNRLVPLSTIAEIEYERGFSRTRRVDGRRTVTIQGDVNSKVANALEIISDLEKRFLPELAKRYPSVTVRFEGQQAESNTTAASIRRGFLLGLVGVFLLLSFQFRSYVEPVIVMVVIPFALVGVVWGHLIMGLDLSMPSMMGFVSLSGIVVNDSILLVEFLKLRRRQGATVGEAARRASRERFRAVLLTSLTTIAGLLPLLFERSLQAQVLVPLVTSIVFGLMATTLLVLLVVPALYTILDDLGCTASLEDPLAGAEAATP